MEEFRYDIPDGIIERETSRPLSYDELLSLKGKTEFAGYIVNAAGDFVYVNDAFVRYTQTPGNKLLKTSVHRIKHTFKPSITEKVLQERRRVSMFQEIINAKKEIFRQLAIATPVFDGDKITYICVTILNIAALNQRLLDAQNHEIAYAESHAEKSGSSGRSYTIVAESPAMKAVMQTAARAAATDSTCLITGETGTGKEIIARYIHDNSRRKRGPLVPINCAAISETLLESELFGYEPGAFTGAQKCGKNGMIEAADGGTLFLDEINSMPLHLQGKLLRVLDTKKLRRVGGSEEKDVDFRLLVSSNQDLYQCCKDGTFRDDLYYRIHLATVEIPPLRERVEDIYPLINLFLADCFKKYGKQKLLSEACYDRFLNYSWPGNVRELRNSVERLVIMSSDSVSYINSIPDNFFGVKQKPGTKNPHPPYIFIGGSEAFSFSSFSLPEYMDSVEKRILSTLVQKCVSSYQIAEILKINQSSVVRKLNKYGLSIRKK